MRKKGCYHKNRPFRLLVAAALRFVQSYLNDIDLKADIRNDVIEWRFCHEKAIVITLGVIIGVTGVLAICAHLADATRLALYVPEDEDDEDIY